jgi:hypothetical protein
MALMVEVGKYHTELVTDLAARLDSFPQAEGKTALDNSLVVWGNEVATGFHCPLICGLSFWANAPNFTTRITWR